MVNGLLTNSMFLDILARLKDEESHDVICAMRTISNGGIPVGLLQSYEPGDVSSAIIGFLLGMSVGDETFSQENVMQAFFDTITDREKDEQGDG